MLASLTDKVLTAIAWIRGVHYDIADFFEDVADKAGSIPFIGGGLARGFNGIAGFFDNVGDELSDVMRHVSTISDAIDAGLDRLAELWGDVKGWISDKLDDAYTWAQNAITQVAGVVDKVAVIADEVFRGIPRALSSLRRDIEEFIDETFGSIPGKISSLWDKVNEVVTEVFAGIPGKLSSMADKIANLPELIKGEILQPIAPFINLVSLFFEDISDFFSDPLDFILSRLTWIAKKYQQTLLDIADKIGDALFGD